MEETVDTEIVAKALSMDLESVRLTPVPIEDFISVVSLACSAGADKTKNLNIARGVGFTLGDTGETYKLTDHHVNHFSLTVAENYKEDDVLCQGLMLRTFAFMDIVHDERSKTYFRDVAGDPSSNEVNVGLLMAAAYLPLSKKLKYNKDHIFACAEFVLKRFYSEEQSEDIPEKEIADQILAYAETLP